jgi:hypothetical protein
MGSTIFPDQGAGAFQLTIHGKRSETLRSGRANWSMGIHAYGDLIVRDLVLQDPLDKEEKELCRWYLEEFRCSPFSLDRADDAQLVTKKYASDLIRQLDLKDLVTELLSYTPGEKRIRFDIVEDDTAG